MFGICSFSNQDYFFNRSPQCPGVIDLIFWTPLWLPDSKMANNTLFTPLNENKNSRPKRVGLSLKAETLWFFLSQA
jgi:hypothetical protein